MNTKTCPNCNLIYPANYRFRRCINCSTELSHHICVACKVLLPISEFRIAGGVRRGTCVQCRVQQSKEKDAAHPGRKAKRVRNNFLRRMAVAETRFEALMAVDKKLPPLSEHEWLEICRHFGGCAICGSEQIETRKLFVNFRDGGKYNKLNVLPLCGKCSIPTMNVENPFRWLINIKATLKLPKKQIDALTSYFVKIIEEYGDGEAKGI